MRSQIKSQNKVGKTVSSINNLSFKNIQEANNFILSFLTEDIFKKETDKINQTIKENKKLLDDAIASQTKTFKEVNEKLGW